MNVPSGMVTLVLTGIVFVDLHHALLLLFGPSFWFETLTGESYKGDTVWFVRTGLVKTTMMLIQVVALLYWSQIPSLLVIVSGVRLTESFADWQFLYYINKGTLVGKIYLLLNPIMNLALGGLFLLFFRNYV